MILHRPSGRARVRVGGKYIYLGKWGSPEAAERYASIIADLRPAPAPAPKHVRRPPAPPLMFADLADRYLREHADAWYRKSGARTKRYATCVRALELFYGAGAHRGAAAAMEPRHLMAFQAALASYDRFSRRTVNEYAAVIIDVYRWGAALGLVPTEVWAALKAVRRLARGRPAPGVHGAPGPTAREGSRITAPPLEDIDAMRAKLHRIGRAMVDLHLASGMRPGALLALRPAHIRRHTEDCWEYAVPPHAYKLAHVDDLPAHLRSVWLGPRSIAVLAPLLAGLSPGDAVFSPRRARAEADAARRAARKTPMYPSHTPAARRARKGLRADVAAWTGPGPVYSVDAYRRLLWRACAAAEIPEDRWISPNQLRHAAATRIREAADLDAAQILLGHSDATTTEIYAEISRRSAMRAARALA